MRKFSGKYLLQTFLWPFGRQSSAQFLVAIAFAFAFILVGGSISSLSPVKSSITIALYCLAVPLIYLSVWLGFVACKKRLHDANRPGWLGMLVVVPIINVLFVVYCGCLPHRRFVNTAYCHPSRRVQIYWNQMIAKLHLPLPRFRIVDFTKTVEVAGRQGETVAIKKSTWLKKIVPDHVRKYWDDVDRIENILIYSLEHDIIYDGLWLIARRYFKLQSVAHQQYHLPALTLLACGDFQGAERLSREYLAKHQNRSELQYTLVRAYERQGLYHKSSMQLAEAVNLDPNDVDLLRKYLADVGKEKDACRQQLESLCEIKGSWLPQLYLMEFAMDTDPFAVKRSIDHALRFRNASTLVVEAIAFLLLKHKRYKDIFRWVFPLYDPKQDGVLAGQVMLKVCVEVGDTEKGHDLLHRLYLLNDASLNPVLKHYADELDNISRANTPAVAEIDRLSLLNYSHPIWFYGLLEPMWLFDDTVVRFNSLTLIPLSVVREEDIEGEVRGESASGQMSRGLPMQLASEIYLRSYLHAEVLMPVADDAIPVVYNQALDFESLDRFGENMSRYVLTGEIYLQPEQIKIHYVIWDRQKKLDIASLEEVAPVDDIDELVQAAQEKILPLLAEHCNLQWHDACAFYQDVGEGEYAFQSLVLEQILNLHLSSIRESSVPLLWGERTIIDNCFDYFEMAKSKTLGLLIISAGLRFLQLTRPEIVEEYQSRLVAAFKAAAQVEESARLLTPVLVLLYPTLVKELGELPSPVLPSARYEAWKARVVEEISD